MKRILKQHHREDILSVTFESGIPGKHIAVFSAVGNDNTFGRQAMERMTDEFVNGERDIARGRVTFFIPVSEDGGHPEFNISRIGGGFDIITDVGECRTVAAAYKNICKALHLFFVCIPEHEANRNDICLMCAAG